MTCTRTTSRLGLATLAAAATVAAIVSTGATASADATGGTITVLGSNFQVGCTYTIQGPADVYAYWDEPAAAAGVTTITPAATPTSVSGIPRTTASWTPTVAGVHSLVGKHLQPGTTQQAADYGPDTVQVSAATPGQTCSTAGTGSSAGSLFGTLLAPFFGALSA